MDLSFEDDAVADEKIPFLAYLTDILKESYFCTFEPPAGSKQFRDFIAAFMKTYHRIPLSADVRNMLTFFPFIFIFNIVHTVDCFLLYFLKSFSKYPVVCIAC